MVNYGNIYEGYVFDGYLMPVDSSWQMQDMECDPVLECSSKRSFESFDITIYNYQMEKVEDDIISDTVFCYEYVFNEIGCKVMELQPKIKVDSMNILYTLNETIIEQYDPFKMSQVTEDDYEDWNRHRARWSGHESFIPLTKKQNYFIVPATPYEEQEEFRKKKMALRDTLVDRSGESWNIATLIYKDKPCLYLIEDVMLKVVLYKNGEAIEEKVIVINLSYGC